MLAVHSSDLSFLGLYSRHKPRRNKGKVLPVPRFQQFWRLNFAVAEEFTKQNTARDRDSMGLRRMSIFIVSWFHNSMQVSSSKGSSSLLHKSVSELPWHQWLGFGPHDGHCFHVFLISSFPVGHRTEAVFGCLWKFGTRQNFAFDPYFLHKLTTNIKWAVRVLVVLFKQWLQQCSNVGKEILLMILLKGITATAWKEKLPGGRREASEDVQVTGSSITGVCMQ